MGLRRHEESVQGGDGAMFLVCVVGMDAMVVEVKDVNIGKSTEGMVKNCDGANGDIAGRVRALGSGV